MKARTLHSAGLALVMGLVLLVPAPAPGAPSIDILICYPGGSVKSRDAKPAMDDMIGVIESIGGWDKGTIQTHFTTKVEECRKLLREKNPQFGIMSLGLFLENRDAYHLAPLAQPTIDKSTTDSYRVLVRKDTFGSLSELKGKTLGGSWLTEAAFLKRIVFKNQIDPAKHFNLKPSRRALRALRKLAKGKLDAVIVNQRQYNSLGSLSFAKDLVPVYTSDPLPQMGVVVNEKKTPKVDRDKLVKALSSMCTHAKGKKLCDLFGIDAFGPSHIKTYEGVVTLWKSGT